MILEALSDYYERIARDPHVEVAQAGFSRQQIAFCVNLDADGSLHEIEDMRIEKGNSLVPRSLIVPGGAKPTGQGINPGFLWDNSAYLLGFRPDDKNLDRTRESFEAFRKRHLEVETHIADAEFSAICRFLEAWEPSRAPEYRLLLELTSGFGVFRLRGAQHFVHERDAIRSWWLDQSQTQSGEQATGQCLVTGAHGSLARLHEPKIKGVLGAQSSGAAIVSFNLDAFESYGKEQSFNAPVSERVTFQYCTALNHLLRSGSKQRVQIGDASTVFWTDAPSPAESFMGYVFDTTAAEDESHRLRLDSLLRRIAHAEYPEELGDRGTQFYVLGLSANASRLSIRFWYVSSLDDFITHLGKHFRDLEMLRASEREPEFPAPWMILRETARESKDVPPLLSGALMRAVFTGAPYPEVLFSAVIRRIRADRQVRYLRAAILKACLNRASRFGIHPLTKEIAMSLDVERPESAYHMGRWFAALEKAQEDALPGINDTIKDRYFGAASATPASVFPRLIRLSQHHLGKLEKPFRVAHEKRLQEIAGRVTAFPSHLSLRDQGLFAIGYYHQRQQMFAKKPKSDNLDQAQSRMMHRYDFVYLFDVKDGNPNGDPDAGNLPRLDPETGQGLVTDVCLKRKVRNYVGLVKGEQPPYEIYVKEKAVLNAQHERAYEGLKLKPEKKKLPKKEEDARNLTAWMCANFFDIRAFGAVMTTEVNCGQVRGPVQFAIARSVEPIVSQEHAVTRCAVTHEKDLEKERTIGRKFSVPYGLYRVHGFINPHLAAQTGFDDNGEDLDLFWTALAQMFETDRSAARGEMAPQALISFEHETPLGNAPANKLFERVRVQRQVNGDDDSRPARAFSDYALQIDDADLPPGITMNRRF